MTNRRTELKFHEDLSTGLYPIYRSLVAERYYKSKRYTYQQITTWQQENIRYWLWRGGYQLNEFKKAITETTGMCFKFKKKNCKECPIKQKLNKKCEELPEWRIMINAKTFKSFAKTHEIWCKKVGNYHWKKSWEQYPPKHP